MLNVKSNKKADHHSEVSVLGAGSWGTALAIAITRTNRRVRLWGRDPNHMQVMAATRSNQRYLPSVSLPPLIDIVTELKDALIHCRDILIAVPSHVFENLLEQVKPFVNETNRIAWATKGLDPSSNQLLHRIVQKEFPEVSSLAVLSGPSFAREVAAGLPTAITIASTDEAFAQQWIHYLHSSHFRVYPTKDMIGVQLCGAVKNVLAIATGINDGFHLGANARAALVTRGLAEMARLGLAMGAQRETFMGLAGLGDLVLTCTDDQSRNRRFGLALAKGLTTQQALQQIGQVVEGIHNVSQVVQLANHYHIEMPITSQVFEVLEHGKKPEQAIHDLLAREPKAAEF